MADAVVVMRLNDARVFCRPVDIIDVRAWLNENFGPSLCSTVSAGTSASSMMLSGIDPLEARLTPLKTLLDASSSL